MGLDLIRCPKNNLAALEVQCYPLQYLLKICSDYLHQAIRIEKFYLHSPYWLLSLLLSLLLLLLLLVCGSTNMLWWFEKSLSFLCADIHKTWFFRSSLWDVNSVWAKSELHDFSEKKCFQEKLCAFCFLISSFNCNLLISCSRFWFVQTCAILILIGARNFPSTNRWA